MESEKRETRATRKERILRQSENMAKMRELRKKTVPCRECVIVNRKTFDEWLADIEREWKEKKATLMKERNEKVEEVRSKAKELSIKSAAECPEHN